MAEIRRIISARTVADLWVLSATSRSHTFQRPSEVCPWLSGNR